MLKPNLFFFALSLSSYILGLQGYSYQKINHNREKFDVRFAEVENLAQDHLSHDNLNNKLMNPYSRNDVKREAENFGPTTFCVDKDNDICQDASFDAVFQSNSFSNYFFKGSLYWVADKNGRVFEGYPKKIESDWPGLPNNLDAAFSWTDDRIYFFKGELYWRFNNSEMVEGYPKKIVEGFPGIPDRIDGVTVWANNDIYFFKGDNFWKYEPSCENPVRKIYPRLIKTEFGDIPDGDFDEVLMQWSNKRLYFFKGTSYWRINETTLRIDKNYPMLIRKMWFNCP